MGIWEGGTNPPGHVAPVPDSTSLTRPLVADVLVRVERVWWCSMTPPAPYAHPGGDPLPLVDGIGRHHSSVPFGHKDGQVRVRNNRRFVDGEHRSIG